MGTNRFNSRIDQIAAASEQARLTGIVVLRSIFTKREASLLNREVQTIKGAEKDERLAAPGERLSIGAEHPTLLAIIEAVTLAAQQGDKNNFINTIANRIYDDTQPMLYPHIDSTNYQGLQYGIRFCGRMAARFWKPDGTIVAANLGPRDMYIMRGANNDSSHANPESYVYYEDIEDIERIELGLRVQEFGTIATDRIQGVNDERIWHAVKRIGNTVCHSMVLSHAA